MASSPITSPTCPILPVGSTIQIHGPHGHFVLQEPITDSIFVATGTGVAPMRAYLEWLFPVDGADRSQGKDIWLVYGTRYESTSITGRNSKRSPNACPTSTTCLH